MTIDAREMNRRLIGLAESAHARFWRCDYDVLSAPERVFRAIWELEAEVNNGGFVQYFLNGSGSLTPVVADALRAIGALAMAEIVERAIETVGGKTSWSDAGSRRAMLDALAPSAKEPLNDLDQVFYSYPDNLTALLYRYASNHRTEIGAPTNF